MSRRRLAWILGGLALLGVALWASRALLGDAGEPSAAEVRRTAREEREAARRERLRRESERLIPPLLEGVYLGMTLEEARRARPRMVPDLASPNPEERTTVVYDERFSNGARGVYVFGRSSNRLERVQVLSLLPSVDAVAPHLAAMHEQYGVPTGVWDCPDTGGVPTRRFTWRYGETTVSDVFLVYGGRVSVTLYVAPSGVIERSLRMGACRPLTDRSELDRFPVAAPEQLQP